MGELLQSLGIQWTKLIPQLFNFGIVLLVLWKWAYKPVFTMLEARQKKIAESVANAEKIQLELAKTEAERKRILTQADDVANGMIEQAREAANRVREVETQKAIAAAEQIITKAREAAAQDHAKMLAELKREVGRHGRATNHSMVEDEVARHIIEIRIPNLKQAPSRRLPP